MRQHFRAACILCIFIPAAAALLIAATNSPVPVDQAPVSAGQALFTGAVRLQNGGPPCMACHSVSGAPFPNGGSLGPDLTGASALLGTEGIRLALQTLFFPTMNPIFTGRPLTIQEQNNLTAFLDQAGKGAPPKDLTPFIASTAVVGFLILLGLAGSIWRRRLKYVRRAIVHGSGSEGGLVS